MKQFTIGGKARTILHPNWNQHNHPNGVGDSYDNKNHHHHSSNSTMRDGSVPPPKKHQRRAWRSTTCFRNHCAQQQPQPQQPLVRNRVGVGWWLAAVVFTTIAGLALVRTRVQALRSISIVASSSSSLSSSPRLFLWNQQQRQSIPLAPPAAGMPAAVTGAPTWEGVSPQMMERNCRGPAATGGTSKTMTRTNNMVLQEQEQQKQQRCCFQNTTTTSRLSTITINNKERDWEDHPQEDIASATADDNDDMEDEEEEVVELNYTVYYGTGGDSAEKKKEAAPQHAVLFLHGLLGNKRNFATIASTLAAEPNRMETADRGSSLFSPPPPPRPYVFYTLDLRNHGQTRPWKCNMSYTAMARDVWQFIQQQNLTHVTLVGHSIGGKVAQAVALLYGNCSNNTATNPTRQPEQQQQRQQQQIPIIEGLVVLDMAPVTYSRQTDPHWSMVCDGVDALLEKTRLLRESTTTTTTKSQPTAAKNNNNNTNKNNNNSNNEMRSRITKRALDQALEEDLTDPAMRTFCISNWDDQRQEWKVNLAAIQEQLSHLAQFDLGTTVSTTTKTTTTSSSATTRSCNNNNNHRKNVTATTTITPTTVAVSPSPPATTTTTKRRHHPNLHPWSTKTRSGPAVVLASSTSPQQEEDEDSQPDNQPQEPPRNLSAPPFSLSYTGDVLFIHGGKSPFVAASHVPTIQSYFPNYLITTVRGAGHWLHAQKTEQIIHILQQYLNRPTNKSSSLPQHKQ